MLIVWQVGGSNLGPCIGLGVGLPPGIVYTLSHTLTLFNLIKNSKLYILLLKYIKLGKNINKILVSD